MSPEPPANSNIERDIPLSDIASQIIIIIFPFRVIVTLAVNRAQ
jgi:hypothetical protein